MANRGQFILVSVRQYSMMTTRILVAGSNLKLNQCLQKSLEAAGFHVRTVADEHEMRTESVGFSPDLIVVASSLLQNNIASFIALTEELCPAAPPRFLVLMSGTANKDKEIVFDWSKHRRIERLDMPFNPAEFAQKVEKTLALE